MAVTYEEILELFKETDTDRWFKETDRSRFEQTDRPLK